MQAPPKYSSDETARRAEEWYSGDLRQQLETEENLGRILAIDVDTGDYAIANDVLTAAHQVQTRKPEADLYMFRIGYPAVHKIGGVLKPYERFRK